MALVSIHNISLTLSATKLFDGFNLQLERGEKTALIGRNGSGKTTLLKMMAGQLEPDGGKVDYARGIKVAYLPQEFLSDLSGSVFDVVLSGLQGQQQLVKEYHEVNHRLQNEYSEELMAKLSRIQSEMDRTNAWEINLQVETQIAQMNLQPEALFETLSGGQKKRAMLARALVNKPDLLLLDEPTNHLDIESIQWLENFLLEFPGTLLFITHDRMFMQNLANRIAELDRGKLYSWNCDYKTFLERKQNALEIEAVEQALFEKKLAQEEIWVRQGVKARRTRAQGRVNALNQMRAMKREMRKNPGVINAQLQEAAGGPRVVIKAENLSFGFGEKPLVADFSGKVIHGEKIGLIGPNGSGKTTFLKLLLGELKPQRGRAELGDKLEIAYFDQLRAQLDEERSVKENICGEGESVTIHGKSRHVMGYLQDFLFTPERARTPVKYLSGGERNRLLLARLFTKPANFLILDEPTNDLDVETLELLENLLVEFSGTLLLVSHDREFLNNVVTSTLVLEGEGKIKEYVGGYDDYLMQRDAAPRAPKTAGSSEEKPKRAMENSKENLKEVSNAASQKPRKMSFKETRELETLPQTIEQLENRHAQVIASMQDEQFYKKPPAEIAAVKDELAQIEKQTQTAYARWEELEELKRRIAEISK